VSEVLGTLQTLCDQIISFKELLREHRKERGWTQGALAMHLNRTTSYVSDLENPEKPLPPSLLLADVLEIAAVLGCRNQERTALIDAFFCAALTRLLSSGKDVL
jgi:transcriptional regulator with XRE-family HTH domain